MLRSLFVLAGLALPAFVVGWGADTHPTIGYLAERFLLDEAVSVALVCLLISIEIQGELHPRWGTSVPWLHREFSELGRLDEDSSNCAMAFH